MYVCKTNALPLNIIAFQEQKWSNCEKVCGDKVTTDDVIMCLSDCIPSHIDVGLIEMHNKEE